MVIFETERWPNVWRAGGWPFGGWIQDKAIFETSQSRWWKQTVQPGAISPKAKKMQIECWKRLLFHEELCWKRIMKRIFRSDPVDETTPHLHFAGPFLPLTGRRTWSGKDVVGDKKKCAGRKRNFLKQCKEWGASRLNSINVWRFRQHNLTANQKL